MKLFKPQLYLTRKLNANNNFEYYLYAVTYFDNTKYESSGNVPFSGTTNNAGLYQVDLLVETSQGLELNYIKPVVHTLSLGELSTNGTPQKIEVSVLHEGQLVGKTVIDDNEAEDDGKPDMQ